MNEEFKQIVDRKSKIKISDLSRFASRYVPTEYQEWPSRYFKDKGRGTQPIDEEIGIMCYLSAFSDMHMRKISIALDEFLRYAEIPSSLNIIDWGCGQALATLSFLEYLENKNIKTRIDKIILIEPSPIALEYATLYVTHKFQGSNTDIVIVNKLFREVTEQDFNISNDSPMFHLYSNVLDIGGINMKDLAAKVSYFSATDNYIISTSPKYWPGDMRIDTFYSYFTQYEELVNLKESNRDNVEGKFTYNIRSIRLLAQAAAVKCKFYSPRQFYSSYLLDCFNQIDREQLKGLEAFDVYAPYEIGTSYKDDIDSVYAVLSNIVSRGLYTKASPYIEQMISSVYSNSERVCKNGTISFDSRLSKSETDRCSELLSQRKYIDKLSPVIFTPIAVARIQKTIIEALASEHLSTDIESWDVLVEESDVPCAALALEDLRQMFNNLTALSEDYDNRKFPHINLTVVNKEFTDSPLHLGHTVYSSRNQVPKKKYDLVIDYHSSAAAQEEYDFAKYEVKTDCYYAVFNSQEIYDVRYVYTTDLIQYKQLTETDSVGRVQENPENVSKLIYFLQLIFRKESFRMGQLPILNRALRNRSVIGLLPTGGGKSLTYQLAAMLQPGITLVIDPLQSLMQDQYDGLIANGIDSCTFINSSIKDPKEKSDREYIIEQSRCQIAFMSPERLCIYSFRKRLQNMYDSNVYFAYGVIDEVHCVSEWGQDFRFTYLHLGRNLYKFVRSKTREVTLFGLTATASFDVLADVERELSGNGSYTLDSDALVRCEDTNRMELQYRIISVPIQFNENPYFDPNNKLPAFPRPHLVESSGRGINELQSGKSDALMGILEDIPAVSRELNTASSLRTIVKRYFERQSAPVQDVDTKNLKSSFSDEFYSAKEEYDEACIIFCPHKRTTNVSVETCADRISPSVEDIGKFYSADDNTHGTNPNMLNLIAFRGNKLPVMVATKAFGMGIDKPNVRYTINVNYSDSLESFVQEAGRAGRDRSMAVAHVLVSDYKYYRINKSAPTLYKYEGVKGFWFTEDDFAEVRRLIQADGFVINDKDISICSAANDLVKLDCEYNKKLFRFKGQNDPKCHMCPEQAICRKKPPLVTNSYAYQRIRNCCKCDRWDSCILRKVDYEFTQQGNGGEWGTYSDLKQIADKYNYKLVARNVIYQNPDYQNIWYFFSNSYPGRSVENETMGELLNRIPVKSFIAVKDDSIEGTLKDQAMLNMRLSKGFMQLVLDSDVGTPTVSIISYDIQQQSQEVIKLICPDGESQETIDAAYSKAIYRMCCIGFIDDFTRDYSKRTFRIVCIRKSAGEYYENLRIYFRRYFSEEKANREVEAAKSLGKGNEVLNCLAYLTEFIYEKLATKKKRSIDEIRSFCSEGIEKNKIQDWKKTNEDLKDRLYYYFNSKYSKSDYIAANGEPYSLTEDTHEGRGSARGKVADLDIVFKYTKVVEDEVDAQASSQVDNLKHLQGAVRILLRALTDDNPTIDLLNVFCISALGEYRKNESLKKALKDSYTNAYRVLWNEFGQKREFYDFFKKYKEDIIRHGAVKTILKDLDEIELYEDLQRHNSFLRELKWS